jgi:hypothetical protein
VHGAEKGRTAVRDAGVCRSEERLGDGVRDGGGGLLAWGAVAEGCAGVGAEEGDDEEGGEAFDDPAGAIEALHFAGCGRGVGGKGT